MLNYAPSSRSVVEDNDDHDDDDDDIDDVVDIPPISIFDLSTWPSIPRLHQADKKPSVCDTNH